MRNLLPKAWYHVWTNAPDDAQATTRTSLEAFAGMLPHGSGLDGDWTIIIRPHGRGLTLHTEWHAMNGDGYYVGWFPVRITLERDKTTGLLSVGTVRVNARATADVGDYLADMLHEVCREA